jgi:excisionase family DNA binding protein
VSEGRLSTLDIAGALADALRPLVDEVAVLREQVDGLLDERHGKRWLTLAEAAERLGCSPDAVRMRARRGRLEHRYQGRRLYVSADAVDRL